MRTHLLANGALADKIFNFYNLSKFDDFIIRTTPCFLQTAEYSKGKKSIMQRDERIMGG